MKTELPKHECPVDGCTVECEFPMLMCAPHWRRVSRMTQEAAWSALALRDLRSHKVYARRAIDEVNEKLAAHAA